MRNALLVIAVVAVLPASPAVAEQPQAQKSDKAVARQLPLKGTSAVNSCAAYGPGFVKVDGTGSCVKIGGAVDVGAGGRR